jgi:hypothetical protein
MVIKKLIVRASLAFWAVTVLVTSGYTQELLSQEVPQDGVTLVRAVMCESISDYAPMNAAVVFSVNTAKLSCYTAFEGIKTTTFTIHKWYRRDELVTTKKLTLKPPRWATYSSIQLREADKGPWRVEVLDINENLLKTIRFSVTE